MQRDLLSGLWRELRRQVVEVGQEVEDGEDAEDGDERLPARAVPIDSEHLRFKHLQSQSITVVDYFFTILNFRLNLFSNSFSFSSEILVRVLETELLTKKKIAAPKNFLGWSRFFFGRLRIRNESVCLLILTFAFFQEISERFFLTKLQFFHFFTYLHFHAHMHTRTRTHAHTLTLSRHARTLLPSQILHPTLQSSNHILPSWLRFGSQASQPCTWTSTYYDKHTHSLSLSLSPKHRQDHR